MTDKIEIDWNDDGFQQSNVDASADLREFTVQYGMDTQGDPSQFRNVPARGSVTLFDEQGQYSTNITSPLTLNQVRNRHLCRITSVYRNGDECKLWEGYVEPLQPVKTAYGDVVTGALTGKLTSAYADSYEVDVRERPVAWHIESQTTLGPATLNTRNETTGHVVWPSPDQNLRYRKTRLGFLNALADYAAAYHWEDAFGYYAFHDYLHLEDAPACLDVDTSSYRMLAYGTRIHDSIELLRNAITFRGEGFRYPYEVEDSILEYGRFEQEVPAWWRSSAVVSGGKTALTLRSNPISHVTLTFPRYQQHSEQAQREIELLRPGVAFDLDIATDDLEVDSKFFCLGAQQISQFNSPELLVVYAVDTAQVLAPDHMILGQGRMGLSELGN